ncbi:Conserved_hypothetical protein [Hexamita inflata]|uniref:Transmembrane protein n=2 Tax=Hexamita inflata TaxID=28002 RepID=A0AA86VS78_9EUKA|nr:Conserved hypothetical protein [Hexamita inflata]
MLAIIFSLQDVAQQTFKTCFSPRSFLRGNAQTNTLTLNLLPFDHIDQINDYNQCKTALDKMNVLAYLHFDAISFPRVGDPSVYFKYKFNVPIEVEFKVSDSDYNLVIDKGFAVFELRYDISYVIVNGSVAVVEHTKYNGTGCFSDISMSYTVYGDIDIIATPNNCLVDFTAAVQVSFDYTSGNQNYPIPIYPCTSGCQEGEYNATSLNFQDITIYRVKKTVALTSKFADFYKAYIDNRMIKLSLNIKFNTNGVQTTIKQFISNKIAVDTWNCVAVDPPTDTYWGMHLYTVLNPQGLFVQVRDTLVNQLKCDTSSATKIRLDHYMFQTGVMYRQNKTMTILEYNKNVGIEFSSDTVYTKFRDTTYKNDTTYSLIVLSFLDDTDTILYEVSQYGKAYMGCVAKQRLQVYPSKMCATITFESRADCRQQYQDATARNHISLYYTQDADFSFIGFFNFALPVNYSYINNQICFSCDATYDNTYADMYKGATCKENFSLMKSKIKKMQGSQVGFHYCNNFDLFPSALVVAEYNNTWLPLGLTAGFSAIAVAIIVALLQKAQR